MSVLENQILRVVASMLWDDGNVNQNVFNIKPSGGTPPYADTAVADDMEDWLDNMYANITINISDELNGNSVNVYKWDTVGLDWDEVQSQSWTWTPTQVSEQVPRGVAALVNLWTEDPDVQGKKYIPGLCEGVLGDGLLEAGIVTNLLAFAVDWLTPFVGAASGATFTPGIWSVTDSVFQAAVTHYAVSTICAYQRRRKRNVGI